MHISRFGVIPKSHQPNKWRLIIDLSHPQGHSVNDNIPKTLCSLSYITVDNAIEKILELGPHTLLAKVDIKSAFRLLPVHPADRSLLAMQWDNSIYIDGCLPFGLRSASKLFNIMADLLSWIGQHRGISQILHYLDDFLLIGPPFFSRMPTESQYIYANMYQPGCPTSVRKDGRASHLPDLSWNHGGHRTHGDQTPTRLATKNSRVTFPVARKEISYEKRDPFPSWTASTCYKSRKMWSNLRRSDVRHCGKSEGTPLLHQTKQRLPIRYCLVAHLYSVLERSEHAPPPPVPLPQIYHSYRCSWLLGLWGLHEWTMAAVGMA